MLQKLKAFRFIISIAAILFVAKPFLGFKSFGKQHKPRISHTILVKSFTKRKPETITEGEEKAEAIHKTLTNPPLSLTSAITLLLLILLPSVPENDAVLSKLLANIRSVLLPHEHTYLLTGKLTI